MLNHFPITLQELEIRMKAALQKKFKKGFFKFVWDPMNVWGLSFSNSLYFLITFLKSDSLLPRKKTAWTIYVHIQIQISGTYWIDLGIYNHSEIIIIHHEVKGR